MITANRSEWEDFVSGDESLDTTHPLIDRFDYFSTSYDVSILVNGKSYTKITRALYEDNELNTIHINPEKAEKDILYKICKVIEIDENDHSKTKIGHKIIYFKDVTI
jgi:hypothetical protein